MVNKNPLSKEKQSEILIQTLGDIVIKSLFNNENSVVKRGIDKLTEIALDFLELKSENEVKYAVQSKPMFYKSEQKNQYVTYIVNEFYRIYDTSVRNRNFNVSHYVFLNLFRIIDRVMSGKNNLSIIEELIETRNVTGSILWKFTESALDYGSDLEKNLMVQHLITIPQRAILEWKYSADYLNYFMDYHIYRINKLIIDKNNFGIFTQQIDMWSTSIQFKDPFDVAKDISDDLYSFYFNLPNDDDINKKCERLQFLITHECIRDFEKVLEIHQQLDEYKELILSKTSDKTQTDSIHKRFLELGKKTNEFYVCSKLYGTFFKIAAYLIFKGEGYSNYLRELWYHTKPEGSQISILNTTPFSESVEWNTLYVLYHGKGSRIFDEPELLDSFQDLEPYHYRYYALILLKLCKVFPLTIKSQINDWKTKDETYKLEFFYELVKTLPIKKFVQSLDEISNLKTLLTIIRLGEKPIETKIVEIRKNLQDLEQKQISLANDIVQASQVSLSKIEEVKRNIITNYEYNTRSNNMASITYDENLSPSECKVISVTYHMKREWFVESKFISTDLTDYSSGSGLADLETFEVYNKIISKIIPKNDNDPDFLKQIQSAVESIRSNGITPNAIFLPLKVKFALEEKLHLGYMISDTITIDTTKLFIINSSPQFDFTEIIVFDSNGLQLSYKSKNKEDKISIEISGIEKDPTITFVSKIPLIIKIVNPSAFVRIINENVVPLSKKK